MSKTNNDVEERVTIVIQFPKSRMLPPIHKFIQIFDMSFNLAKTKGQFFSNPLTNLG